MASFLLIHGAGHDSWCWDRVHTLLADRGHDVDAPDLPCTDLTAGLSDYAEAAAANLANLAEPPVVVGHSLGALTAAVVAARRPVRRLVFVAGIIGAPNKSLEGLAALDADRDLPLGDDDYETDDDGRFRFTRTGAEQKLYPDCSPELVAEACRHLRYQRSMWTEVAPFDAWPGVETHSIICRDDRVVSPEWSRRVSRERVGAECFELDGGHSPMLSRPNELADLLLRGL